MTICTYSELCNAANMSTRTEYYSGRGATLSDLDGDKLEIMHGLLKTKDGDEAANNFIRMVADIPVLSATDFLLTLQMFLRNGCRWETPVSTPHTGGIAFDNEGSAMATIAEVLCGSREKRNDTHAIRGMFLHRHGYSTDALDTGRKGGKRTYPY